MVAPLDDPSSPLQPVLIAGGSGTRLWPLSRADHPKQFLAVGGEQTLFQATLARLQALGGDGSSPITICHEAHRFLVAEQMRARGEETGTILLEPASRSTAPAVALAALEASQWDPEALLLVLPADHVVADTEALADAVAAAREPASRGGLVTFGIKPTAPATGFGYIRVAGVAGEDSGVLPVAQFVEKPDAERARSFLEAGDSYWNSGMFLFRADAYLAELNRHAPDIRTACQRAFDGGQRDLDFLRVGAEAFEATPARSIDCALMEPTDAAYMVPVASH